MTPGLILAVLLALFSAVPVQASDTAGSGSIWRVTGYHIPEGAALTPEQAEEWFGKAARISQTAISFEGRTCRVTPEIEKVQAGVLLAAYQATPAELDIPDQMLDVVDTGCDTEGFGTMLSLEDGRFVLVHKGGFIFLEQNAPPLDGGKKREIIRVPEAGLSLALPSSVRMLAPRNSPEPGGLGFWFEAMPLSALPDGGAFPFDRQAALLLRGALASSPKEGQIPPALAPPAVAGSLRVADIGEGAWSLAYATLKAGDTDCPVFRRSVLVFRNGWLVHVSLEADAGSVIRENPGYFAPSAANAPQCPGGQAWTVKPAMDKAFWSALDKGRFPGLAGRWQEAFQELLEGMTLETPSAPGFLAKSHESCRNATPAGGELAPGHTFTLRIPGIGDACLLTIATGEGHVFRITTVGGLNELLDPTAALSLGAPLGGEEPRLVTRALGVDDLNADALPDVIAIMETLPPAGEAPLANRIFFSRAPAAPSGASGSRLPSWRGSAVYDAAVAGQPTVADTRLRVAELRDALRRKVGEEIRLAGTITSAAGGFANFQPEQASEIIPGQSSGQSEYTRYRLLMEGGSLLAADGAPLSLPAFGERLELTARVLDAEDLFGPLTLTIAPITLSGSTPPAGSTHGAPAGSPDSAPPPTPPSAQ